MPAGDGGQGRSRSRSIASRWSAGGWPGARGRTARTPRCRRRGPPRAGCRPAAGRPSSRRADDLGQALGPDPARDGLAARLVRAEAGQHADELEQVGPVVDDHDRAGPEVGARGAQRLEVVGRVEHVGRQQPARRAADQHGLDRAAGRQLAAEPEDVAQRRARAGPRRCRSCRRVCGAGRGPCPGSPGVPVAANASAPSRTIHGTAARVWTLWTRVGRSNRPALGGMRRALLGLAALALERLEQDGLLAEHVRALDRPDLDVDVVAGAETSAPRKPASVAAPIAARQARDDVGVLGADGDERLARADRVGRDGRCPR